MSAIDRRCRRSRATGRTCSGTPVGAVKSVDRSATRTPGADAIAKVTPDGPVHLEFRRRAPECEIEGPLGVFQSFSIRKAFP